ncbi:CKLF-like MARVEL transmembrane domain-containing protein 8 isoform X1 [Dromiciops gliroides]|uniref:CKLF-like MARVEL transmembrane domain-containing protein 8 isoform X1 n=1 Tax=Dromiciops gliroides TaxID=33562 RepID=UPI001CC7D198|nr:CKLF-like MARVEL transmembrane domain-containing protein 8 isoform X1 [Dromiciops gliroides]
MEEPQRSRSHTVTTTASSFTENFSTSSSSFAYDKEFLRTLPGILIVAEIVFGLLVWTLIAGTEYFRVPAFGWVMFVAVFYWVLTVFFLIIYMTMTYTRIPQVPWTTVGLCFNGSAFVLYLIAAIVDASSVTKERDSHNYNSWAASSHLLGDCCLQGERECGRVDREMASESGSHLTSWLSDLLVPPGCTKVISYRQVLCLCGHNLLCWEHVFQLSVMEIQDRSVMAISTMTLMERTLCKRRMGGLYISRELCFGHVFVHLSSIVVTMVSCK